ncbi:MAG: protein kinase [Gemmataceae bacterium]
MSSNDRLIELFEYCKRVEAQGQTYDLTQVCQECPELQPELERLLRLDSRLEGLLNTLETGSTPPGSSNLATHDFIESAAPPVIPGYQVETLLASGGMGQVYRARDLHLERTVALKVIRPDRLSADLQARFLSEARAVAALDHPHIVHVYEVGEYPTSSDRTAPYLAMEFVPGGTLESRATKSLSPATAARTVQLLARAMAHAHGRGVVHRDLKPANILLAPPADEPALNCPLGRPRITDFGLARRQDASSHLTTPGAVLGTPAYMAPEQAEGQEAGPPADVYALGAILYRLLTGRPVFEADSMVTTLFHICNTPPRPLREIVPGVSPELEALCLRCLAKKTAERPTAGELADIVGSISELSGPTQSIVPSVSRVVRPRRRVLAGLLALAALVLVGVGLVWRLRTPQEGEAPLPPLKGFLDARMTRPGDKLRDNVPMNDPAARPLRPGDEIRVYADLNRPAYAYLIWIDSEGQVTPMYPWIDGDWSRRGPEEKTDRYRLPRFQGDWGAWPMGPGKPGLETMLLICRDDPLPEGEDLNLKSALGTFGPQKQEEQNQFAVLWCENGEPVRDEPQRAPLTTPVAGGNPLERVNRQAFTRLRPWLGYIRSITYVNLGDR